MANTQDAQNLGKIEAGIKDLISQSKDELEKEASLELQRQMGKSRREMTKDIEEDVADNIYQNKPPKGIPLTLDDKKKNVRDRSIRQTNPEHFAESHEAPDKIYRPEENANQPEPKDMFDDLENAKQQEEAKKNLAQEKDEQNQQGKSRGSARDPDFTSGQSKQKDEKEKGKKEEAGKTTAEAPKTGETPKWEMPDESQGSIIPPKKSKTEKPKSDKDKQGQQEQNGKELRSQKRAGKREQYKKDQAKQRAAAALSGTETSGKEIGKMSSLSFMFWIFLAVICDLGSLIPYVGLIFSWPFAAAFASYKWIKKIKKEVAIATTALDFILEGLLSTLPVNTIDVIITFIVSRSKTVRAVTQKMPSATPKK